MIYVFALFLFNCILRVSPCISSVFHFRPSSPCIIMHLRFRVSSHWLIMRPPPFCRALVLVWQTKLTLGLWLIYLRGRLMRRGERPPLFHLVQHPAYMRKRVVLRVAHHSVVLALRDLAHVVALFDLKFCFLHLYCATYAATQWRTPHSMCFRLGNFVGAL